jgi:prepilin-type N-terminal cleavage/methylation domain-containing protein/prepilin-type processing-associated H-X9-DG protein
MPSAAARRPRHGRTVRAGAFTLIEVLVVVSIIALLVAILLPSLARAREQSRGAVCLSQLKQQGSGLSAYSSDNRGTLPRAGSFRFTLMEGNYYLGAKKGDPTWENWVQTNIGFLYPRYVGSTTGLFYCPNNKAVDKDGPNGASVLVSRYRNARKGSPGYHNAHDFPASPFTSYGYALPALPAKSPRDAGSKMYPQEIVQYGNNTPPASEYPYWVYLNETADPDPSFLGPFPRESRGRHPVHALVSDGFFASEWEGDHKIYEGYHLGGYNVLFGDFHARRVIDPAGKIHKAGLQPVRPLEYGGLTDNERKVYMVWDYFSRNP